MKQKKRVVRSIVAWVLCLAMILTSVQINSLTSKAATPDGSRENPYQITNQEDFLSMVKSGSGTEGKYYVLMNDISLTDDYNRITSTFYGVFDGRNHKITLKNISINMNTITQDSYNYNAFASRGVGLMFGENDGTIMNLNVVLSGAKVVKNDKPVGMTTSKKYTWTDYANYGVVCGLNAGVMNNVSLKGSLDCGGTASYGGIAYQNGKSLNPGEIYNCHSEINYTNSLSWSSNYKLVSCIGEVRHVTTRLTDEFYESSVGTIKDCTYTGNYEGLYDMSDSVKDYYNEKGEENLLQNVKSVNDLETFNKNVDPKTGITRSKITESGVVSYVSDHDAVQVIYNGKLYQRVSGIKLDTESFGKSSDTQYALWTYSSSPNNTYRDGDYTLPSGFGEIGISLELIDKVPITGLQDILVENGSENPAAAIGTAKYDAPAKMATGTSDEHSQPEISLLFRDSEGNEYTSPEAEGAYKVFATSTATTGVQQYYYMSYNDYWICSLGIGVREPDKNSFSLNGGDNGCFTYDEETQTFTHKQIDKDVSSHFSIKNTEYGVGFSEPKLEYIKEGTTDYIEEAVDVGTYDIYVHYVTSANNTDTYINTDKKLVIADCEWTAKIIPDTTSGNWIYIPALDKYYATYYCPEMNVKFQCDSEYGTGVMPNSKNKIYVHDRHEDGSVTPLGYRKEGEDEGLKYYVRLSGTKHTVYATYNGTTPDNWTNGEEFYFESRTAAKLLTNYTVEEEDGFVIEPTKDDFTFTTTDGTAIDEEFELYIEEDWHDKKGTKYHDIRDIYEVTLYKSVYAVSETYVAQYDIAYCREDASATQHNCVNGICIDEGCNYVEMPTSRNGYYQIANLGNWRYFVSIVKGNTEELYGVKVTQNTKINAEIVADIDFENKNDNVTLEKFGGKILGNQHRFYNIHSTDIYFIKSPNGAYIKELKFEGVIQSATSYYGAQLIYNPTNTTLESCWSSVQAWPGGNGRTLNFLAGNTVINCLQDGNKWYLYKQYYNPFGTNAETITNCLAFYEYDAESDLNSAYKEKHKKSDASTKNGQLCYELNNKSSVNPGWYQNIDNQEEKDPWPVPFSEGHGIVYYHESDGTYSNYPEDVTPVTISGLTFDDMEYCKEEYKYEGTPEACDKDGNVVEDIDFTFEWYEVTSQGKNKIDKMPVEPGDFQVVVTAKNSQYYGEKKYNFSVTPKKLKLSGFTAVDKVYDGKPIQLVGGTFEGVYPEDEGEVYLASNPCGTPDRSAKAGKNIKVYPTLVTFRGKSAYKYCADTSDIGITANITPMELEISYSFKSEPLNEKNEFYCNMSHQTYLGIDKYWISKGTIFSGDDATLYARNETACWLGTYTFEPYLKGADISGYVLVGATSVTYSLIEDESISGYTISGTQGSNGYYIANDVKITFDKRSQIAIMDKGRVPQYDSNSYSSLSPWVSMTTIDDVNYYEFKSEKFNGTQKDIYLLQNSHAKKIASFDFKFDFYEPTIEISCEGSRIVNNVMIIDNDEPLKVTFKDQEPSSGFWCLYFETKSISNSIWRRVETINENNEIELDLAENTPEEELKIYAYDKSGRETKTTALKIKIDRKAPSIVTCDSEGTVYVDKNSSNFEIGVADAGYFNKVYYTVDDSKTEIELYKANDGTGAKMKTWNIPASEGSHTYHIYALDNYHTSQKDITVVRETSAPVITSCDVIKDSTAAGTVTMKPIASDDSSGVSKYYLVIKPATESIGNTDIVSDDNEISLNDDGEIVINNLSCEVEYAYKLVAVDNCLNESAVKEGTFTIPKGIPEYTTPDDMELGCFATLDTVRNELPDRFTVDESNAELIAGENNMVLLTFTPEDTDNYALVENIEINVNVDAHSFTKYDSDGDATCLVDGHETAYCDNECGAFDRRDAEGSALGHKYSESFDWDDENLTCEIIFTCTNECCDESVEDHEVTFDCQINPSELVASSCTEMGTTRYTATYDKYSDYKDVKNIPINPSAHSYENGVCKDCYNAMSFVKDGLVYTVLKEAVVDGEDGNEAYKAATVSYNENGNSEERAKVSVRAATEEELAGNTAASGDIVLPETLDYSDTKFVLTKIEDSAFADTKVTSVTVPKTVDTIGANAFSSETITAVTFEGMNAPAIDDSAFAGSKVTKVTVPEGATSYKNVAAFKNANIEVVEDVPPVIEEPDEPDDPGNPGGNIKKPVKNGEVVKDATGVTYTVADVTNKTVVYTAPVSKQATSVTVPDTVTINGTKYKVTKIAPNAFKNCKKLKKIKIGKDIVEIGANAFYGCKSLTKLVLPANVMKIGANAFYGCKKLKTLQIKSTKLVSKNLHKKSFKGLSKVTTIKVPKKVLKSYKKLLKKKGLSSKVKVKK